jgi:hypothetical protein
MAKNTGLKVGLGAAGAALAAAAAAGAYFFYGSEHAAKNRKQMRSWMVKAKGEVMEQLENLGDVTQSGYDTAVAEVMDKYKKLKNIDPKELAVLTLELKKGWQNVARHINSMHKKPAAKKTKTKGKKK